MKSEIKSISVILNGSLGHEKKTYTVGKEYNGLLLDKIIDYSVEDSNSLNIIFQGKTEQDSFVFEIMNAPITVEYQSVCDCDFDSEENIELKGTYCGCCGGFISE